MPIEDNTPATTTAEVNQAVDVLDDPGAPTVESDSDAWLADHGLEAVSDEDLRGILEEEEDEADKPGETGTEDKDEEDDESGDEETESPPPSDDKKPPKGYVPTQAVQEVRQENRYLKQQLQDLEAKFESFAQKPAEAEEPQDTFKVLSKDEFNELASEDPREAMAYMMELQEYKETQAVKQREAAQQAQEAEQAYQVFNESYDLMEKVAPGIFDEDSPVQEEMVKFAESMGFTEDLFFLTNPETRVILPGENKPVYMGRNAAEVLRFVVGLKEKVNPSPDTSALEAKIRKEVETELLKKFKASPKKDFKSLSDIPPASRETPGTPGRTLSETEMADMSEAELEKYLSGE